MAVAKERALTPEHRKAISEGKNKNAETTLNRAVDADLIDAKETRLKAPAFHEKFKGSNAAMARAHYNTAAERITKKINPDGTKMSLKQEIDVRKASGYGAADQIKKLEAKLNGGGEASAMSLEDALKALG